MSPRSRAVVALVASLGVLVASGIAWASSTSGVGMSIEPAPSPTQSPTSTPTSTPTPTPDESPSPMPDESATAQDEATTLPDVPLVDATQIVIPDAVPAPRALDMASIGVRMPVRATGVTPDGQMELPDDPAVLGWYEFGALPGDEAGSAVLAAHVDSSEFGVGPLAGLASVQVGDVMTVTGSAGARLDYRVTSVERIKQAALPVDEIFRPDGDHQLVVVTCGGRYLPDAGGYEDNIVVTATPVAG